jgi:adenylyl- and sulfurtransferase ThiI
MDCDFDKLNCLIKTSERKTTKPKMVDVFGVSRTCKCDKVQKNILKVKKKKKKK